jgi:large subunit ribosomal protein L25
MKKNEFKIEKRDTQTRAKAIRNKGLVPGNVFGSDRDSTAVQFDQVKFNKLFLEIGESGIAYLKLEKEEVPVMIDEVQLAPVSGNVLHVSFKAIDLSEKIRAEIPVELEGEFEIPEAVLVRVRDQIEVEALPTDLPEKFVVDVSTLKKIGQSVTLDDLAFDQKKVSIIVGEEGMDAPVVLVQEVEEEVEEEIEETIETEIIGEEDEEGEDEVEAEGGAQVATHEKKEE